jgi:Flp pilus assembly protein TadG
VRRPERVAVRADERGQVAIVVALTLTVMLGFGALVVDVGLNWAARTQLQSAADAAALAAAAELPGQPDEAMAKVRQYLDDNIAGLAGVAVGWESDADAANGDVTCYRPPAAPPPPGDPTHGCNVGDTAIQVITPPLRPAYAFASILGRSSAEIKALAAAGAPPGPEAPCALCVLSPDAEPALLADGSVTLHASDGDVVVDSDGGPAAATTGTARITMDPPKEIRVVGGVQSDPGGGFDPLPQTGGVPVADPLSNLPRPDQLGSQFVPPDFPVIGDVTLNSGSRTLSPGIYGSIRAGGGALALNFTAGLYVITGDLRIGGRVFATVGSATLYFACANYPQPCADGSQGAGLTVTENASFTATATNDLTSPYNGLAVFYDRSNSTDLVLGGTGVLSVTGSIYARGARLDLHGNSTAPAALNSMVVVDTAAVSGSRGREFRLDYNPNTNVSLRTSAGGLVK